MMRFKKQKSMVLRTSLWDDDDDGEMNPSLRSYISFSMILC